MEELRRKILKSAKKNFLDIGYKHSSLEKIAEDAGVEVSAIRALFQDKRELVEVLMKELSDPFMSTINFVSEDENDVRQFIRKALTQYNHILIDNPEYVTLFHHLMHDDPEIMLHLMEKYFFPLDFFQRLKYYQEKGEFVLTDPLQFDFLIDSIIFFPHLARRILEQFVGKENTENYYESLIESVLDVFENGLYKK